MIGLGGWVYWRVAIASASLSAFWKAAVTPLTGSGGEFESVVEFVDGDEGSESFACFFGRGRLGDGTFVIEFGYICCQSMSGYVSYVSWHVSCM